MKKRRRVYRAKLHHSEPIPWLPIDSRLFPFFSFGHVKGVARIFLQVEMILATSIVVGTMIVAVMKVMS